MIRTPMNRQKTAGSTRSDDRQRVARGLRGQSHVVGVAILLATTMVSLGLLTASVGVVLEDSAGSVAADRVAADLDSSLEPTAATGVSRGQVSFVDGELTVRDRSVRVLNDSGVVYSANMEAIVFETERTRVSFAGGMIASGGSEGDTAVRYADPPIVASEEALLIGIATLNSSGTTAVAGDGGTTVPLRTDVSHDRRELDGDNYEVAVETATPGVWERHFEETGASTTRRSFADDRHESVVGEYDGHERAYLVVHDLSLEVGR